ncbi:MAG: 2-hydroxymuconate tautomerase [Actinomycetes bacterium]|jgi:4-oxalocrotonate tautomerase
MPLVQVTMVEGRTVQQKHALIAALTQAVVDSVGSPADRVRVAIYEVSADDWGVGGLAYSVARAPKPEGSSS